MRTFAVRWAPRQLAADTDPEKSAALRQVEHSVLWDLPPPAIATSEQGAEILPNRMKSELFSTALSIETGTVRRTVEREVVLGH